MEGQNHASRGESSRNQQHNTSAKRRRKKRSPVWFVIKTVLLLCIFTGIIFTGIFSVYIATCIVPNAKVDVNEISMDQSSVIYYQAENGEWKELETLHGGTNSIWADIETMPDYLLDAAVAIEDRRFYQHNGVDWLRTGKAVVNLFVGFDSTFGGSTLTQQTIKNLTGDTEGTVKRKITEIFRALDFEKEHSKKEILELYLNNIYLGHGCRGVQTAAKTYFGKDVSELTLAECADLIGITNNPSLYDPYNTEKTLQNNLRRKDTILGEMRDQGHITESEYRKAMAQELVFTSGDDDDDDDSQYYSWFVDQLINDVIQDLQTEKGYTETVATQMVYYGGLNIYCTQDPAVQKCVDEVYNDKSNLPYTSQGYEMKSAITIIDPYTGNIVAMAGDIGEKQGSRLFNYATAKRQCGSAIKPISAYAPALDAGVITPASIYDDAPVRSLNGRSWPVNSHSYFDGLVTIDSAITQSLNTVAVRVVEDLGIQESYDFMTQKLGFTSLVSAQDNAKRNDMNSASLALGGLTRGVSTVEMAAAFASFANSGIYTEPRTYTLITDQDGKVLIDNEADSWQAMSETTAYFMNKYLHSVVTSGTGGSANFSGMTVAGKTGTTTDNYDRYFAGYTPYYAAAVWTGYEVNVKINASGNPSAQLFKKVMSKVHANLPNKSFSAKGNVSTVSVCLDCGKLATELCGSDVRGSRVRSVEVAKGTAPTETCTCHVSLRWCTASDAVATDYCPEESVVTKSAVNYTRSGVAASANCRDEAYHLAALQSDAKKCTLHNANSLPPTTDPDETDEELPDNVEGSGNSPGSDSENDDNNMDPGAMGGDTGLEDNQTGGADADHTDPLE